VIGEKLKSNNSSSISIKSNARGISAEMTVAAGRDRVWRILTSFDEMDAHLSGLKKSKVLRKEGNYLLVEQTVKVGIPLLSFNVQVVMDVVEDRPFLHFSQRQGSFAFFRGHWKVEPASEGTGTKIAYYLEVGSARSLGNGPLGNRLIKENLQQLAAWIDNGGV
jgi:carbon monoxide dehydrogenase subunit G